MDDTRKTIALCRLELKKHNIRFGQAIIDSMHNKPWGRCTHNKSNGLHPFTRYGPLFYVASSGPMRKEFFHSRFTVVR